MKFMFPNLAALADHVVATGTELRRTSARATGKSAQLTNAAAHAYEQSGMIIRNSVFVPSDDEVNIRNVAISDLFFNTDHPQYDKVKGTEPKDFWEVSPVTLEPRAALLIDATEWAITFKLATGVDLNPSDLVNDFMDRL